MKIKEVIFFANGDPRSASTWSNVPCCFVKELEQRGIVVHTVNLASHPLISNFYDLFLRRIFKLLLMPLGIQPVWFSNSWLYKYWGYKKVRKAVEQFHHADYCFFINYLFCNKFNDIPSLLLSDWPQIVDLHEDGMRQNPLYQRVFAQEREAIENAQHVISIFKVRAEMMQRVYPKANIHFLGGNVINNLCPWKIENGVVSYSETEKYNIVDIKEASKSILFIGKPDRYLDAARKVVDAFCKLKKKDSQLRLNIIGFSQDKLGKNIDGVKCYGFLHKDIKKECEQYYRLLLDAKVIVNPNPKWAAYSSMIEAMYFYTPVIVAPYDAFGNEFGENIEFGIYNEEFTTECVAENIDKILSCDKYITLCEKAHRVVRDYSWNNYVNRIIQAI